MRRVRAVVRIYKGGIGVYTPGTDATHVITLASASEKVFGVAIVATRWLVPVIPIDTVIPIEAAARPLETREASSVLPVAIALARASEKVFGVAFVATRWIRWR